MKDTEQFAVPVVAVALRVQLVGRLRAPKTGALEKATTPVGVPSVPALVSVTVTVQLTGEPVSPGEGEHATAVEVDRLTAVRVAPLEAFTPPLESVAVTEMVNAPGVPAVTTQVVSVGPHPEATLSPSCDHE